MQRILIRHLAGSRVNQIDEFVAGDSEIIAGRDTAAQVRFDPDLDDLVSRQHTKIVRDPWDPNAFQLLDLQSRNGTFLNRQRVYNPVRLNHNDVVQLGAGGPEFRFELDPPPPPGAAPADQGFPFASAIGVKPTRESWLPDPQGGGHQIGRATVQRMLGDVFTRMKKDANRSLLVTLVALLVIVLAGVGIWLNFWRSQADLKSNLNAVQQKQVATQQNLDEALKGESPALAAERERVEQLEKALKDSNTRNDANQAALARALEAAKKQLAAAIDQDRSRQPTAAPPPPAPAPLSETPPPAVKADATFDSVMAQVQEKLDRGEVADAQTLALKLTRMDPNRWEGYALAGESAAKLPDYKLAIDMYQRAIAHAPAEARPDLEEKLRQLPGGTQK